MGGSYGGNLRWPDEGHGGRRGPTKADRHSALNEGAEKGDYRPAWRGSVCRTNHVDGGPGRRCQGLVGGCAGAATRRHANQTDDQDQGDHHPHVPMVHAGARSVFSHLRFSLAGSATAMCFQNIETGTDHRPEILSSRCEGEYMLRKRRCQAVYYSGFLLRRTLHRGTCSIPWWTRSGSPHYKELGRHWDEVRPSLRALRRGQPLRCCSLLFDDTNDICHG